MRALARLDGWQQRHSAVAFPAAVVRKFLDDRAGDLAALIAYYAFFSLFPLLLVFVSVLGFVLEDDPGLQADLVDSAVARIPAVGPQVAGQIEPLTGSGPALAIGLATALWAGLGVTLALGRAFEHIWDVPRVERRGPVRARLHGLAVLAVLGSVLIAATVAAGLAVGGAIGPAAQRAATLLLALAVNAVVFGAAFVLLSPRPRRLRRVLPGVAVAAVSSLLLQVVGGWYVDRVIVGAADVYGAFALVIGLLSWFLIVAGLVLLAAEVNVVLARRLWPRSLTGAAPRSRPPAGSPG